MGRVFYTPNTDRTAAVSWSLYQREVGNLRPSVRNRIGSMASKQAQEGATRFQTNAGHPPSGSYGGKVESVDVQHCHFRGHSLTTLADATDIDKEWSNRCFQP